MADVLGSAIMNRNMGKPPRVFETTKKEVGNCRPGDDIELNLMGKIQSVHDDGRVFVRVTSVESDESEDSREGESESSETKKTIYVKTQESHVP